MVGIRLEDISVRLDENQIFERLSWKVEEGELMVLVGPSGCGKTTLLKIILGSLTPLTGKIYFDNLLMNDIPISKRNIGFVSQNFGLFPHLNVIENIRYGLKMHNVTEDKIKFQESKYTEMLHLNGLELRSPNKLSWGQQQRVALARALAIEPNLLLLDEPLSSVDWAARRDITGDIFRMQKSLRITTIYVTHDIDEAFEIGDKITVMSPGIIEQCSIPEELIKNPKSKFVSAYIGKNKNLKRFQALMEST
jgi:ABC-type sugar transport system ATPase subunit